MDQTPIAERELQDRIAEVARGLVRAIAEGRMQVSREVAEGLHQVASGRGFTMSTALSGIRNEEEFRAIVRLLFVVVVRCLAVPSTEGGYMCRFGFVTPDSLQQEVGGFWVTLETAPAGSVSLTTFVDDEIRRTRFRRRLPWIVLIVAVVLLWILL